MRIALGLLLTAGCIPLVSEGGTWTESGIYSKSPEEARKACLETLEKKGFKIAKQDEHTLQTEWKVTLSPHYRQGNRDRLDLELLEAAPGKSQIRIRASRDVNDNPRTPMSEKDAEWISAGGNDALAEEIQMLLKLRLKGVGLDD